MGPGTWDQGHGTWDRDMGPGLWPQSNEMSSIMRVNNQNLHELVSQESFQALTNGIETVS